jgi:hypothetical protein
MSILANSTFTLSRDRLDLADLDLNSGTAFSGMNVVEWGPGSRQMNLMTATSPVSNGSVVINATAQTQDATITVRVWGTPEDIAADLEALTRAFNQLDYTLVVQLADDTELASWRCGPADSSIGDRGTWNAESLSGGWQDITFTIPVQPASYRL